MRPWAATDGHDFPRLVDKLVPGLAAVGNDIFVGVENRVVEPVAADELPDVLDRIEFGGSWRQGQKGDVGRDGELVGGVPSGLIEDEDGVSARCHLG